MQKQIVYTRWIEIDSSQGSFWLPQDLIGKTAEPTVQDCKAFLPCRAEDVYSLRIVDGYGARLSMPGYLDCTEWSVFQDESEALDWLEVLAGDSD